MKGSGSFVNRAAKREISKNFSLDQISFYILMVSLSH